MKKFLVSLIVLALCLFTIACGSTTSKGDTDCNPDEEDCDTEPTTEPTDEPTNPTDEPTNPTDEPTNPTDEPTNPTDEPTEPTVESDCNSVICKIQKGITTEGTEVTTECVVTAVDIKSEKQSDGTYKDAGIKGLYVSDIISEAKPYTGIYVFIKETAPLGDYEIGDKLEVKGIYKEYYESSQIESTGISKLGKAEVPAPAEIEDPATIATPFEVTGQDDKGYDVYSPTANHGADAETYESVFVKVKDVEITNKYLGNANFEVTGGLAIAPTIHKYTGDISKGTKFESIQGILIYSYDAFRLAPRSDDDLVVAEPTVEPTEPTEPTDMETTIKAIQSGTKAKKDLVKIENAIVISPVLSKNFDDGTTGYTFYVSDGNTGDYSGLYIYQVTAEAAPAKGDKVTIEGQVDFYGGQWEVKNAKTAGSITKTGTGTVPAVLEKASYTALSDKDKGSLIELTDELTVKSVETPGNYTKITFEEKVGDKELIAENFGSVTFPTFQAGDKLHVKGIYDVIFGSNGFYILNAGDLEKRIY